MSVVERDKQNQYENFIYAGHSKPRSIMLGLFENADRMETFDGSTLGILMLRENANLAERTE